MCLFIVLSNKEGNFIVFHHYHDKPTTSDNMNRKIKLIRVEIWAEQRKKNKHNCLYLHFLRTKIMWGINEKKNNFKKKLKDQYQRKNNIGI